MNNIIAIMYDFDKTLITKDMQEYTFIPDLGIESSEFWSIVSKYTKKYKTDSVLAYMYCMLMKTKENGKELKSEYLKDIGKYLELYPGVLDWFDRINEYAHSLGLEVEHYIISSGLKEIICGSQIANKFKEIYASEFLYDDNDNAIWPKLAVNYTNKTQFIYRINKGVLDISDDNKLNKKMLYDDRRIMHSNMIYIGDGLTDVPCMQLTKDHGGVSIAVYTDESKSVAKSLLQDERISYITKADYSKNSELEAVMKMVLNKKALDMKLKGMQSKLEEMVK